eukprot:TRINITY_DN20938_c0_g1_i2.p1 TRINITY_DN20938_c0_g1~~TRINITY_DN20938_c0_g1_i2.p1  ORF type:complete len:451 (+),score=132.79 TRINITY_DN20938_c0_g1_i2:371-1723(+)
MAQQRAVGSAEMHGRAQEAAAEQASRTRLEGLVDSAGVAERAALAAAAASELQRGEGGRRSDVLGLEDKERGALEAKEMTRRKLAEHRALRAATRREAASPSASPAESELAASRRNSDAVRLDSPTSSQPQSEAARALAAVRARRKASAAPAEAAGRESGVEQPVDAPAAGPCGASDGLSSPGSSPPVSPVSPSVRPPVVRRILRPRDAGAHSPLSIVSGSPPASPKAAGLPAAAPAPPESPGPAVGIVSPQATSMAEARRVRRAARNAGSASVQRAGATDAGSVDDRASLDASASLSASAGDATPPPKPRPPAQKGGWLRAPAMFGWKRHFYLASKAGLAWYAEELPRTGDGMFDAVGRRPVDMLPWTVEVSNSRGSTARRDAVLCRRLQKEQHKAADHSAAQSAGVFGLQFLNKKEKFEWLPLLAESEADREGWCDFLRSFVREGFGS